MPRRRKSSLPPREAIFVRAAGLTRCCHLEECTCACEHPECDSYCQLRLDQHDGACQCRFGHKWKTYNNGFVMVIATNGETFWTKDGQRCSEPEGHELRTDKEIVDEIITDILSD